MITGPRNWDYRSKTAHPIYEACLKGNHERVVELYAAFSEGQSHQMEDGTTPFHAAAESGSFESINHLLKGLDPNLPDKSGNTPLHVASWVGNQVAVEALLKGKANPNLKTKGEDLTPLHYAAFMGHVKVAEALLNCEAYIDTKDSIGRTALHYACEQSHADIIRLLIKKKADLDVVDNNQKMPMDILNSRNEIELIIIMANHGADVEKLYNEKWNINLQKAFEKEDGIDTSTCDFYGFHGLPDSQPNPSQRIIKKRHIDKWKKVIQTPSPEAIRKSERSKIQRRIWKDRLPDEYRGQFWRFCLKISEDADLDEYNKFISKKLDPAEAIQIDKDVNRCLRAHRVFLKKFGEGQCKLFRVLKAYASFDSGTKYTQGMSTIAAILLLYFPAENMAYAAMKRLFSDYSLHSWYANNLQGLQQNCFPIFETLLSQRLPKLHNHLTQYIGVNMGVDHYSSLFVTNWFLELYYDSLPWHLMLRVWDMYIFSGPAILYSVGIAMLEQLETSLMQKKDMAQMIGVLKNTEKAKFNYKYILKKAFLYHIDNKKIESLEEKEGVDD